jgi:hypothetical protein
MSSKKELKTQENVKEPVATEPSTPFKVSNLNSSEPPKENKPISPPPNPTLNTPFNLSENTVKSMAKIDQEFDNIKLASEKANPTSSSDTSSSKKANLYSVDIINPPASLKQHLVQLDSTMGAQVASNASPNEISFDLSKARVNGLTNHLGGSDIEAEADSGDQHHHMLEMPKRNSFLSITCQLL